MRNRSITRLTIGTAVAVGMSVLAITAVAQPPVEPTQAVAQEAFLSRYDSLLSKTNFRLSDRQQLKSYFDGRFK